MNKIYKKIMLLCISIVIIGAGIFSVNYIHKGIIDNRNGIGRVLDSYKGVQVFYNGYNYAENHGKNYNKDGYYYGYKWQCVEYVKRFYYEAKGHVMPDVYGNAKDFFDSNVGQGKLNKKRGLLQYKNGDNEKPQADDLLVFTDTNFGHVVIVSKVEDDYIEVIQQNMGNSSRDKFKLECKDGKYFVGEKRIPAGWLRKA